MPGIKASAQDPEQDIRILPRFSAKGIPKGCVVKRKRRYANEVVNDVAREDVNYLVHLGYATRDLSGGLSHEKAKAAFEKSKEQIRKKRVGEAGAREKLVMDLLKKMAAAMS